MCIYKDRFSEVVIAPIQKDLNMQKNQLISRDGLFETIMIKTSLVLNEFLEESYRKYRVGRSSFDMDTINRPLSSLAHCVMEFCVDLSINTDLATIMEKLEERIPEVYTGLVETS